MVSSTSWRVIAMSFGLLLVGRVDAVACSCQAPGPPCQNYFQSDVVFIGTVRSITPVTGGDVDTHLRVEFEDVVASRGVEGTVVAVFTSDDSIGSCGFPFTRGARYVVYAGRRASTSSIVASICSRTRLVADGDEDLKFFKSLSSYAAVGAGVRGSVTHWARDPATGDPRNEGPVGNVKLTLRDSKTSFETRTGTDGRYQLADLPAGRYELTAAPPPPFSARDLTRTIELRDRRACVSADFSLRYDGRISGFIVDADGRLAAGAHVELLPADRNGTIHFFELTRTDTDAGGRFELTDISPGRYLVGINVLRTPGPEEIFSPTAFYPGVSELDRAEVIDVGRGERVELGRVALSRPRTFQITGKLLFEDGTPAGAVEVSLSDGNTKWKQVAEPVRTNSAGEFSFEVAEGLRYVINARHEDPATPGRTRADASLTFVASAEKQEPVEVTLQPVRRK